MISYHRLWAAHAIHLILLFALAAQILVEAETREFAIQLSAAVETEPPKVMLRWESHPGKNGYMVYRKAKDDAGWGPGLALDVLASSYIDTDVQSGRSYEYTVRQEPLPYDGGAGHILVGISAPLEDFRGTVVLLVDVTQASELPAELGRLEQDLIGDGWRVIWYDVHPGLTPGEVKELIQAEYWADPVNVRAVFLFGRVPVPYSGNTSPDGHRDHRGAWPADVFYGDMDGTWTDLTVATTIAERSQNWNVPGDGKFDQTRLPSLLELEVGRVDLTNLPAFAPKTETDLLRQYLDKNHAFRHGVAALERRGLIADNFGAFGGEAFAANGWRNFAPLFGAKGTTIVKAESYFPTLSEQGYLWSYACGGGTYEHCSGVGTTGDFEGAGPKAAFNMLFGSYFGDWDARNSFLRGALAAPTHGLTAVWAGRPHWFFHHMALGETIGYSTRLTQNNGPRGLYHPSGRTAQEIHVALMGDPTLRTHPVLPPSGLTARQEDTGAILSWNASSDREIQGYHVYAAVSLYNEFARLTEFPVTDTTFIDPSPNGACTYMVRAIKLEQSPSGTYYNASQGVFATFKPSQPGVNSGNNATDLTNPISPQPSEVDWREEITPTPESPETVDADPNEKGSLTPDLFQLIDARSKDEEALIPDLPESIDAGSDANSSPTPASASNVLTERTRVL